MPYEVTTHYPNMFSNANFAMHGNFAGSETFYNIYPFIMIILMIIMAWTIIWKGLALWKAAKNNSSAWFVILLIVNTFGILEIIYYYFLDKEQKVETKCAEKDCVCITEVKEKIEEDVVKIEKAAEKWWYKIMKRLKK